jgi:hypothetical protein
MHAKSLILALASAALLPVTLPAGDFGTKGFSFPSCDKRLTDTITALEHLSWDLHKIHDVRAARALFADDFVEILAFGEVSTKAGLLELIASGQFTVYDYVMSDVKVVRLSATSALIRYRMLVNYDYMGDYTTDDLWAMSVYSVVGGTWRCRYYHETYAAPVEEPAPES